MKLYCAEHPANPKRSFTDFAFTAKSVNVCSGNTLPPLSAVMSAGCSGVQRAVRRKTTTVHSQDVSHRRSGSVSRNNPMGSSLFF